jgi:hypothetical protein
MKESDLQEQVATFLKFCYPDVLFHSDFGAGVRLTMGQAIRQKKQNGGRRAWPDMVIAEPRNGYHGLYLELKREKTRLKKKNGEWASDHIAEQAEVLKKLRERGYKAEFAVGFDEAKQILDDYLGGKK